MTPLLVDGVPERIDARYFRARYSDKFSVFSEGDKDDLITAAVNDIYTMFTGVQTLWSSMPLDVWYDKTRMCFGLLTAWYIADLYPEYTDAVASTGGMPIKSKSIAGIRIIFSDTDKLFSGVLDALKTNVFGYKAWLMITSSAKRAMLYVT